MPKPKFRSLLENPYTEDEISGKVPLSDFGKKATSGGNNINTSRTLPRTAERAVKSAEKGWIAPIPIKNDTVLQACTAPGFSLENSILKDKPRDQWTEEDCKIRKEEIKLQILERLRRGGITKGISFQDCKNGTGMVEFIPKFEWIRTLGIYKRELENSNFKVKMKNDSAKIPIMGFGKYRDKTVQWVKDNNRHYFHWAEENVEGFKKRVDKLGIK